MTTDLPKKAQRTAETFNRLPNRYTVGTGRIITLQDTNRTGQPFGCWYAKSTSLYSSFFGIDASLDDFSGSHPETGYAGIGSTIAADVANRVSGRIYQPCRHTGHYANFIPDHAQAAERLDWQTVRAMGSAHHRIEPNRHGCHGRRPKGLFALAGRIGDQYEDGAVEKMTDSSL